MTSNDVFLTVIFFIIKFQYQNIRIIQKEGPEWFSRGTDFKSSGNLCAVH